VTPLASEISKDTSREERVTTADPLSTSIHSVNKTKELQLLTSVTNASTAPRSSVAIATNPYRAMQINVSGPDA
jgi:hypothetical protein